METSMKEPRFTSRELDVMSVLWRESSGTVAEVKERLSDELAYTTVLWVLQTLEEKGFIRHEREGRAHRYIPLVGPEAAGASALDRIVDKVFHGSAEMLLAQLVSERELPPEELQRMRDLLDRRLAESGGEP
jgi:BlaI family penicillinase repressor